MIVDSLQVRKPKRAVITVAVVAALSALTGGFPTAAGAQAVCDEYSISPLCRGGDGGDGGNDKPAASPFEPGFTGDAAAEPAALTSELATDASNPERAVKAAKGEIPVAGYPATPIIILLAALLGGGMLIRMYLAVRDRMRNDAGGGPFNLN